MSRPLATESTFRALADPTRRRILEILRTHDRTAAEIAAEFSLSWPTISSHLRVLRGTGLISQRRTGRRRQYTLHAQGLRTAATYLQPFIKLWR